MSARALDPRLHRPVFVIGAPRSGTTFLGSCLGRLPFMSYHFEPRLTKAPARCVYEGRGAPAARRRCSGCPTVRCCSRRWTVVTGSRRRTRRTASSCRSWPRSFPARSLSTSSGTGGTPRCRTPRSPGWPRPRPLPASGHGRATAWPAAPLVGGTTAARGVHAGLRHRAVGLVLAAVHRGGPERGGPVPPGRAVEVRYEAMVTSRRGRRTSGRFPRRLGRGPG